MPTAGVASRAAAPLVAGALLLVAAAEGAGDRIPRTWPFSPPKALRAPSKRALPRLWADGRACSTGCRPAGAVAGWPIRPFHRQHVLRAGLNELRPATMHVGVDILTPDGTPVYAMQPGRAHHRGERP